MAFDHTNPGLVVRVLLPVRGDGVAVHLVDRRAPDPMRAEALCGAAGPLDARARPTFRRVRSVSRYCVSCLSASCAEVTRIDWS